MQVREALRALTDYFTRRKIETPKVDAETLLAFVLGCRRLDLFLDYHRPLTEPQMALLRDYSIRRGYREPLQYLLGSVEFYGQTLRVTPDVLIPRHETEELVHQCVQYFLEESIPTTGLDLGTGSGAIAIALASTFPKLQMTAVDLSPAALDVACDNAIQNHVQERICFVRSRWFEKVKHTFDFIVANPPYLSETELQGAQPEVRCFEPKMALVSAESGMQDLKHILKVGRSYLNHGGLLLMEIGLGQHEALQVLAKDLGYKKTKSTLDLSHRKRYLWSWIE